MTFPLLTVHHTLTPVHQILILVVGQAEVCACICSCVIGVCVCVCVRVCVRMYYYKTPSS